MSGGTRALRSRWFERGAASPPHCGVAWSPRRNTEGICPPSRSLIAALLYGAWNRLASRQPDQPRPRGCRRCDSRRAVCHPAGLLFASLTYWRASSLHRRVTTSTVAETVAIEEPVEIRPEALRQRRVECGLIARAAMVRGNRVAYGLRFGGPPRPDVPRAGAVFADDRLARYSRAFHA